MTHGDRTQNLHAGFHGPRCWIASAFAGLLLGILASFAISTSSTGGGGHHAADLPRVREIVPAPAGSALAPVAYERLPSGEVIPWLDTPRPLAEVPPVVETSPHAAPPASNAVAHHAPNIPLWLCAPFGLLLASIALMPFINAAFWARHFPDFAFFLGALITGFYLLEFGSFGRHAMLHAAIEYYSFIALVGGLFVVLFGQALTFLQGAGILATIGGVVAILIGVVWFWLADWDWRNDLYIISDTVITLLNRSPLYLQYNEDQVLLSKIHNIEAVTVGLFSSLLDLSLIHI